MILAILKTFLSAPVCYVLMTIITLVSLVALKDQKLFFHLVMHPNGIVASKEYYRLMSGDLIHNDLIHLLINQIMLFTFGARLENHLLLTTDQGSLKFLIIFVSSCLTAGLLTTIRHWREPDYSNVGTSGSIIGCMLGYVMVQPDIIAFYLPVIGGVRNIYGGLICIIAYMIYQFRSNRANINHEVHFFGGLGGILATWLLNW